MQIYHLSGLWLNFYASNDKMVHLERKVQVRALKCQNSHDEKEGNENEYL